MALFSKDLSVQDEREFASEHVPFLLAVVQATFRIV